MIRWFRHDDTVHREDNGAVRFDDLAEKFKAKFDGTSQWSIEAWTAVNRMYANQDVEEVQYDLEKPRITVSKKILGEFTKTKFFGAI